MQKELSADGVNVGIVGINQVGHESASATICEGRDLPWLEDTDEQDVWNQWGVVYRDVVVLDSSNNLVRVYNLTGNDLAIDDNYATLSAILRSAAK